MKIKVFGIISLISIFLLISCNTAVENNTNYNFSEETAKVSFKFETGRSIVSAAEPTNYTYTLKGTFDGETITLCENISQSAFLAENFSLRKGEWTFRITAYKNRVPLYADLKSVIITADQYTVNFKLSAVIEGTGSVSVRLNYPANKGVTKVTAKLYDSIPAADEGSELTLGDDSSVTFTSNTVPAGVTNFLKFYLYNSQNVCIGTYIESVYLIRGDSINVIRSLIDVNSFAATVYITVTGTNSNEAWNNSGFTIKAVKDNKQYALQALVNTNYFTASLPIGIYDIYNGTIDTDVDLTVSTSGTSNATVHYDSKFVYATIENFANVVSSLTTDTKIVVTGTFSSNNLSAIKNAINSSNYYIDLDLSGTTGLTELQSNAFSNCSKLKSIKIPNTVTTLNYAVFYDCDGLECIEIPDSVTAIDKDAFGWIPSLTTIVVSENNPNYASENNLLLNRAKTTIIRGCNRQHIIIPNTVESISNDAFLCLPALESIEIPNTVTSIGARAFIECWNLTAVEIPNSVTSIGMEAFDGCRSLQSITIPNSITNISAGLFCGCDNLICVEIPDSVTSISNEAFAFCSNLQTINYRGSPEQWNNINKATSWNYCCPSTMVINYNYQE